ncbi:hypothetical protein DIS09_30035 [Burkholderia pseudomallei]|uniref:Uncharacterized protein n=1 Tax=Burkholderia pseudomallei (strain 1026b) TaxID=884204 RepID=A0A0H3HJ61_BURP2|nr:hypothetical protein BP1026B_I0333 [Burkholderia pseudomallei 1026b]ARK96653.1 hypothetical protein BOC43_19735 [Burkholderia pseudomallei]EIF53266.1 hypothetical protein BP1026A_5681 [Burkholderia pseudomallei 1026a]PNW99275.1 hypothetical protein CF640_03470 [Burkholderia pseudomallei]PNX24326.1 hypothetical protein CF645_00370 [Burkholderia pseudomallei]
MRRVSILKDLCKHAGRNAAPHEASIRRARAGEWTRGARAVALRYCDAGNSAAPIRRAITPARCAR